MTLDGNKTEPPRHQDTKDTKNTMDMRYRDVGAKGNSKGPGKEVDDLAHAVIGAALEVHRTLGPGFLESVYEEALCVELRLLGIPFVRQPTISVACKGQLVGESRLDLLIADKLIVELKSVDALAPIHTAQAISYLKATACKLALLINFNVPILRTGIKRVVL